MKNNDGVDHSELLAREEREADIVDCNPPQSMTCKGGDVEDVKEKIDHHQGGNVSDAAAANVLSVVSLSSALVLLSPDQLIMREDHKEEEGDILTIQYGGGEPQQQQTSSPLWTYCYPQQPPTPHHPSTHKASRPLIVPSFNYSMVHRDVHRSAHPNPRNKEFICEFLRLKTIVCLCYEDHKQGKYPKEMVAFYKEANIELIFIHLDHVNEPFAFPNHHSVISRVLSVVMSVHHHPVLIHCEDGKHQTGIVCSSLRKAQQWSLSSILAEFALFNGGKQNLMVQRFVDLYQPVVVTSNPTSLASWMLADYDFQFVSPTSTDEPGERSREGNGGGEKEPSSTIMPQPPPLTTMPLHTYELEALNRFHETSAVMCNPGTVKSAPPLQIIVILPPEPLLRRNSQQQQQRPSWRTTTSSGFGSTTHNVGDDLPMLNIDVHDDQPKGDGNPHIAATQKINAADPSSALTRGSLYNPINDATYFPITSIVPKTIAAPAVAAYVAAGGGDTQPMAPKEKKEKKDKKPK